MEVGMMWLLDASQTDLTTKIKVAAEYYLRKYGRRPNRAVVNSDVSVSIDGMTVSRRRYILPRQVWIGIEDKE